MVKRKKIAWRNKRAKRSKKPVENKYQKEGVFLDNLIPKNPAPPPADPMLGAYVDEIHKAAQVRDRAVYLAQKQFAWALADAWRKWKGEG